MIARVTAMSRVMLALAVILSILLVALPSQATAQSAGTGGTMVIGAGNDPGQFNPGITTGRSKARLDGICNTKY